MGPIEQLAFAWEAACCLPYIYYLKLMQAHQEFTEDFICLIPT